jgi:hypothetical protein
VVFITEDSSWTSLQVSYLLSSRSDLFLGSFIADGYIFQSTNNNQLTLNYVIPNWQSTASQVIAVTEFAGLRTFLSQPLSLSFVSTTINGQNGLLKAVVSTNSPFEMLYLTYYWWVVGATEIAFSSFTPGDGTSLAYQFVGIDSISGSQVTYAGSGFNRAGLVSCSGSQCPSSCITPANCQSLGGVVSGSVCTFCGVNSQWNGNACVCLAGYNLINGVCGVCPSLSAWMASQQACVCLSGYYLINGACTACQANSGWNGSACVCLSGYYLINNVCSQCPPGTVWSGSACVCPAGTYLVNGACQHPPPNTVYNGNGFVCISNYYLINGVCSLCPSKSTWNGNSCVCNNNFYMINGVCIQCGPNSTFNGSACVCNNGYYLINNVCAQCQQNSAWNGTACVCITGFYPSGKNCLACGPNSVWNGSACACLTGYYLINNVCTACAANQVWNGNSCVCASNFHLVAGVCQTCPAGTNWNGSACIPNCPPKAAWNGNACVCQTGFYQIQGSCLPCDPNSLYDGTTCNCNPGYFGNYQLCTACDVSCATCSQAGPNGCSTCPVGVTIYQGACVAGCGVGKVSVGGICVNCPSSCLTCSDANTCTECAQNFTLLQQIVNGNSVIGCTLPGPSSPGSKLALTGIVVANSYIYQGVTLSSLPAYFLTSNCANCSDLFTVLIIPNNLGLTYSIQYVLYSQYWFIITFNYMASGITPNFQFKVQLNFKYANYFTSADMAQGLLNSVSPLQYPTTPAPAPAAPTASNSTLPLAPRPRAAGTFSASAAASATPDVTRPVVSSDGTSTVASTTLVKLFG